MARTTKPEDSASAEEAPKADPKQYSGRYKYLRDGRIFALKILPETEVRMKKTHYAKCDDGAFGDYTESEFRAQFDKL